MKTVKELSEWAGFKEPQDIVADAICPVEIVDIVEVCEDE